MKTKTGNPAFAVAMTIVFLVSVSFAGAQAPGPQALSPQALGQQALSPQALDQQALDQQDPCGNAGEDCCETNGEFWCYGNVTPVITACNCAQSDG